MASTQGSVFQPNERTTTRQGSPSQGLSDMPLDQTISGRMERRLPIILVVRLAVARRAGTDGEERTYTDNVSAHGARVFSTQPLQPDDEILVTPVNEETVCANVIYCQRLADDRYGIGVKFQGRTVTWSALRRFDGIQISSPPKPKSS
jgi:hypothetical protein